MDIHNNTYIKIIALFKIKKRPVMNSNKIYRYDICISISKYYIIKAD